MSVDIIPATGKRRLPLTVILLLALTAAISLLWSHHKLLSQDEIFVLQTDSVRSVGELVRVQRTYPISLDPLAYHLLAHAATKLFGATAFALRLPSLLGYLLMQMCLFLFVRRAAGDRAGLIAIALPALTATLFYSAEARPYGLLLGLYATTLLSWQCAARDEGKRTATLVLLALSIALALNAHYFGILLLITICSAELFRTISNRRLDLPVAAAIFSGMAGIVFVLPFKKAAGEFRLHYYNAGDVTLHAITQSYRALLFDYTQTSLRTQHVLALALVVAALGLIIACFRMARARSFPLLSAETVFILLLAALPFFGFLLARFVTHSIEVRYVLGAILGITVLVALALAPLLRSDTAYRASLALLIAAVVIAGAVRVHGEARNTADTLASLTLPSAMQQQLLADPANRLYLQNLGHFEVAQLYAPDPAVRARLTLVYDAEREIRLAGHDTHSLTTEHLERFTAVRTITYERLQQHPGPHLFIVYASGWDWAARAFAEDHASAAPLGAAFGGQAMNVQFNNGAQLDAKP